MGTVAGKSVVVSLYSRERTKFVWPSHVACHKNPEESGLGITVESSVCRLTMWLAFFLTFFWLAEAS